MQRFFNEDHSVHTLIVRELGSFFEKNTIQEISSTENSLVIIYFNNMEYRKLCAIKEKCPSSTENFLEAKFYYINILYAEIWNFFRLVRLTDEKIITCCERIIKQNQQTMSSQILFYLRLPLEVKTYFNLNNVPEITSTLDGLWIDYYGNVDKKESIRAKGNCPSFIIMNIDAFKNTIIIDYNDVQAFFKLIGIDDNNILTLIHYFEEQLKQNKNADSDASFDGTDLGIQLKPKCCNIM